MALELDEFRELYDVTFKMYNPDVRLPQNTRLIQKVSTVSL